MTEADALVALSKALQPAAEYCLFWVNWWPMCMTKSEWASWAQFVGTVLAIMGSFWAAVAIERRATRHMASLAHRKAIVFLRYLGSLVELGPQDDLTTVKLQRQLLQQQIASGQAIDAERLDEEKAAAVYMMRMVAQRVMQVVDEYVSLSEMYGSVPPANVAQHSAAFSEALSMLKEINATFASPSGAQ